MSLLPANFSLESVTASLIRRPEYRRRFTNARMRAPLANLYAPRFEYTSVAQRSFSISESVNGIVGFGRACGAFRTSAGFSRSQPESLQNLKNDLRRSSFFLAE